MDDTEPYDLKSRAERVRKNKPKRPVFQPVEAKDLTDAFTRGCALRTGCIASALDKPRADATEGRAGTSSKGAKRKRKQRGLSKEGAPEAPQDPASQEKKAKVERPTSLITPQQCHKNC